MSLARTCCCKRQLLNPLPCIDCHCFGGKSPASITLTVPNLTFADIAQQSGGGAGPITEEYQSGSVGGTHELVALDPRYPCFYYKFVESNLYYKRFDNGVEIDPRIEAGQTILYEASLGADLDDDGNDVVTLYVGIYLFLADYGMVVGSEDWLASRVKLWHGEVTLATCLTDATVAAYPLSSVRWHTYFGIGSPIPWPAGAGVRWFINSTYETSGDLLYLNAGSPAVSNEFILDLPTSVAPDIAATMNGELSTSGVQVQHTGANQTTYDGDTVDASWMQSRQGIGYASSVRRPALIVTTPDALLGTPPSGSTWIAATDTGETLYDAGVPAYYPAEFHTAIYIGPDVDSSTISIDFQAGFAWGDDDQVQVGAGTFTLDAGNSDFTLAGVDGNPFQMDDETFTDFPTLLAAALPNQPPILLVKFAPGDYIDGGTHLNAMLLKWGTPTYSTGPDPCSNTITAVELYDTGEDVTSGSPCNTDNRWNVDGSPAPQFDFSGPIIARDCTASVGADFTASTIITITGSGSGFPSLQIPVDWWADDELLEVRVNGVAQSLPGLGASNGSFTLDGTNFVAGPNTVEFDVHDVADGVQYLRVDFGTPEF